MTFAYVDAGTFGLPRDINRVPRPPQLIFSYGPRLQQDEVAFTPEVLGHLHENRPIESFLIEANAAPLRDVLKDLIGK